jgi:hypothetical protein
MLCDCGGIEIILHQMPKTKVCCWRRGAHQCQASFAGTIWVQLFLQLFPQIERYRQVFFRDFALGLLQTMWENYCTSRHISISEDESLFSRSTGVWTLPTADTTLYVKGKAVPLQASSGPEGSRKLRFPDFVATAQDGGKVVRLTPREYPWYSFLLEAESTPGP